MELPPVPPPTPTLHPRKEKIKILLYVVSLSDPPSVLLQVASAADGWG